MRKAYFVVRTRRAGHDGTWAEYDADLSAHLSYARALQRARAHTQRTRVPTSVSWVEYEITRHGREVTDAQEDLAAVFPPAREEGKEEPCPSGS